MCAALATVECAWSEQYETMVRGSIFELLPRTLERDTRQALKIASPALPWKAPPPVVFEWNLKWSGNPNISASQFRTNCSISVRAGEEAQENPTQFKAYSSIAPITFTRVSFEFFNFLDNFDRCCEHPYCDSWMYTWEPSNIMWMTPMAHSRQNVFRDFIQSKVDIFFPFSLQNFFKCFIDLSRYYITNDWSVAVSSIIILNRKFIIN